MAQKQLIAFAKHDPMHCLAPGLFRSLAKGDRKKDKLDITYAYGEDQTARFVCFEPLDAFDMRVLQGLVALSGPKGLLLTAANQRPEGQQLLFQLDPQMEAAGRDTLVVKESMNGLLTAIGLTGGQANYIAVKTSLFRLAAVTVGLKDHNSEAATHLLSYAIDELDGQILVALNYLLSEAVLGKRHTRIDMTEVRRLKSDPARLMHQRLCAFIAPGETKSVGIDVLVRYVWFTPAADAAMRKRRQYVKEALRELVDLGWQCGETAKSIYAVSRPDTAGLSSK